ncbi:MAG: HAD-IA family hydrolase [Firmicutes bacterium]|nr:HAD-IA family hydrolase [Bacillota bacterium]
MKNIKAVLFDFDGTIFDTNKLILESWQEVFRIKGGSRTEEEILATFGEPLVTSMEKWFPGQSEECINIYRNYQKDIFFEKIELYEGMDELIKKLKTLGIFNAIVTSRLTSSTVNTLEKYDLARYFDVIVTCDDTQRHKPDPEPALLALEKLGISAEEAIMIGDSKFDIRCAHNAGIKAALVGWSEAASAGEIPENGQDAPDFVINSAEELLEILA